MSRIHLSAPDIREPERALLLAALDSGWVAPAGPALDAFEADLALLCGVESVVAMASGTAALHLALLLVGVRPGDDVLVPTFTFVASANAVVYCGARPCFIDSEPGNWNLSAELLAAELDDRRRRNDLPAAVVAVDLYGQCAAYDEILPICDDLGIPVVEDAAEALGATWCDRPAGSHGRFGVLSFNGNKIVTTSGGGALLCHSAAEADRARFLATQAREPVGHYEHREVGYNYRLSNLLAALGSGQLVTLGERISRRREIRARYEATLGSVPGVRLARQDPRGRSNAWLSCLTIEPGSARCPAEALGRHLQAHDIEARPLWKPMHAQPVFAANPSRLDGTSDALFATGLCLPSGSGLSDDEVDLVIDLAQAVLGD